MGDMQEAKRLAVTAPTRTRWGCRPATLDGLSARALEFLMTLARDAEPRRTTPAERRLCTELRESGLVVRRGLVAQPTIAAMRLLLARERRAHDATRSELTRLREKQTSTGRLATDVQPVEIGDPLS